MGTPHKNFNQNFESPYARHLPQYPSQSEGFVPNEVFAAKSRVQSSTPYKQNSNNYNNHHHGNNSNNYQSNYNNHNNRRRGGGNNRYFNVNRGAGSGGNSSGGGGYPQNNYQSNYQPNYNNQHQQRYSNSGNRQQQYYGQKFNKTDNSGDYYHPSMLVDPWKELLERHNALKSSQIEVPSSTEPAERVLKEDESSSASSSPSSHHDDEDKDEEEETKTTPAIPESESTTSPSIA